MSNLLDYQFIVRLILLSLPKDPLRVFSHIVHIRLSMNILFVGERDGKAGSNFLRVHSLKITTYILQELCLIFPINFENKWLAANVHVRPRTKLSVNEIKKANKFA